MGQYSIKGSYAGYDKNNEDREEFDFYATPPEEVVNILEEIGIEFDEVDVVYDPCCGAGHMLYGVRQYSSKPMLVGNDIVDRIDGTKFIIPEGSQFTCGPGCDFLSNRYSGLSCPYIILNPPFKQVIPFVNKSLDIATKGMLMLCRLKFLETQKRYEEIFSKRPPTDVYIYIDRIACYKNGDFSIKPNSVEAYAWFYWDKTKDVEGGEPKIHWIWSCNHKDKKKTK